MIAFKAGTLEAGELGQSEESPLSDAAFSALNDEAGRLAALEKTGLLDTSEEEPFELVVDLVRKVLNVPICAVSLVDRDRQWFKAARGLKVTETPREISFCAHTISSYEPFMVENARAHPLFHSNPLVCGDPNIASYIGIPLRTADDYNLGSLCAIDTQERSFSDREITLLKGFAALVMHQIELREQAANDLLTGALTRRIWERAAHKEILRSKRHGYHLSLICLDIDHFKSFNDRFGHAAGDAVLTATAKTLVSCIRETDLLGRTGGEEFTILCSGAKLEEAVTLAERCRQSLAMSRVPWNDGTLQVTASFGVTDLHDDEIDLKTIMARADQALYEAKRKGRDRVEIAR